MIYPSEFVVRASGRIIPTGEPAMTAGRCAMCGKPHNAGDSVLPFEPASGFTDWTALAVQGSKVVCTSCIAVWHQDFTQRYAKSVVTEDGVYPAAKNDHIAWWLMNPPSGPFMFYQSDQKQQHLVWRTPVNLNRDVFYVRFGAKMLTIRRTMLERAVTSAGRLCAALTTNKKGAPPKSPFRSLDREMSDFNHAQIRPDIYAVASSSPELSSDLDVLLGLTPGEIWGLSAVLYAKDPHKPPRSDVPAGG